MKSTWDIDKGYQPPFDRLCQKVEEQEKTIQELTDRLDALESDNKKQSDGIATAVKTELMLSCSLDRIKKDIESLKGTQGSPTKILDWLFIFTVVSVVLCWVIIPAFGIWFK